MSLAFRCSFGFNQGPFYWATIIPLSTWGLRKRSKQRLKLTPTKKATFSNSKLILSWTLERAHRIVSPAWRWTRLSHVTSALLFAKCNDIVLMWFQCIWMHLVNLKAGKLDRDWYMVCSLLTALLWSSWSPTCVACRSNILISLHSVAILKSVNLELDGWISESQHLMQRRGTLCVLRFLAIHNMYIKLVAMTTGQGRRRRSGTRNGRSRPRPRGSWVAQQEL